jgi:hypothetical protein
MKNLIYNCFLFLIIVIFAYINSLHTVESFTPKIKEMYRPYVRNARIIGEGFYNKSNTNISNLFRKFGIM